MSQEKVKLDIPLEPVISGTVAKIGYNEPNATMRVEFNSGVQYDYYDISEEQFLSIKNDKSIGSKLRSEVKNKEYTKL